MFGPLNEALEAFQKKWQRLVDARSDKQFFAALKPLAVGWKTEDLKEFDHLFKQFRSVSSMAHLGWINGRWVATFVLRDTTQLIWKVPMVKLMQRRPGSTDPVGLDHIDFYDTEQRGYEKVLLHEPGLKWSHEDNGEFCKWISIWFDGTEAKLRTDTTLDVGMAEMRAAKERILDL